MQIDPIKLQKQNKLIKDYRNQDERIMNFFDYPLDYTYEQRASDLKEREFNREELADVLYMINRQWDAPKSTLKNIERFRSEESVVVIGGQQAGIMTGPMYTINKVISIIQLAREQEDVLKIPVIPVFWIAGEDHDYEEINHLYLIEDEQIRKQKLHQHISGKYAISDIEINHDETSKWIDQLFKNLTETEHTKGLYESVKKHFEKSTTYVDFFARLIFDLFHTEGVVLIDSAHPKVRELESGYFLEMIEQQPIISSGVYAAHQQLIQSGYSVSLEVEENDAHLFIDDQGERILLTRTETGEWIGKQNEIKLTNEEMIHIAKTAPERLSNNVVTRPLMQELLFPSLAFVGGGGEISYWAALKPAFQALQIKMPPIIPRLSFTYLDQKLKRIIEKYAIDHTHVINYGVEELKGNWLAAQQNPPIEIMFEQLRSTIDDAHRPLRKVSQEIRSDLGDLATKNFALLERDISYLENRINQVLKEKFIAEIADFDYITHSLHPKGGLQERVWNILPLINRHGKDFITTLTEESCSFKEDHYIVSF